MKSNRRPACAVVLALGLMLSLAGLARAVDPGRVAVGDTVRTRVANTSLYVDKKIDGQVAEDVPIKVTEISGKWIAGTVEVAGKSRTGWFDSQALYRPDSAAATKGLDALKTAGATVEMDHWGSVLEVRAEKSKSIEGKHLARLDGFYALETLNLVGSRITNDDLKAIAAFTNLRRLYLGETAISDAGLAHLAGLSRLNVLDLHDTKVTGSGLKNLKSLEAMHTLNLSNCPLKDAHLEHLAGHPGLLVLALEKAPIDGSGIVHLGNIKRLNVLNVQHCKLQPKSVLPLKSAQGLRILFAEGATIDEASKAELDAAVPSLAIFD